MRKQIKTKTIEISTKINAIKLWAKVIVKILLPSFFKLDILNSPPIEKAIKPKAIVTMIDKFLTVSSFNNFKQYGPMINPITR